MRWLTFMLLFAISTTGYCQIKSFKEVASVLNGLTDYYNTLQPFQLENIALKDSGLTLEETATYSSKMETDSIDVATLQSYYQVKIENKLKELTSHKDFGKYDLEPLINIEVIKSSDNKLYNFIYDENTGGTYRSRVSYVYYIGQKGPQEDDFYNPDGYNAIEVLKTKSGTKYVLTGVVVGCGSCQLTYLKVVHYENGKPKEDFSYLLDTRIGYENSIEYNAKTKTIEVNYFTDDLQSYCKCTEGDSYPEESDSAELKIHKCGCTFKFNGEAFILTANKDEVVSE